ncbi:hypothetical protein [Chitinophaga rhizophila]|uniref:Transmembrane protein n=1 Tax=Chitinophaga rhizophila TaxID=2866212 RepID=A0ABS7G6W5_9BACT|nr:hypothetical protein [Chitinophaga rhizophila]MBW8683397.1 hypothetical protein [Chitinophaga rhizophila]
MGNKSFYDLDYIIELNEQRLEQYTNALQKNTEKFTTLLVIYSTLCIFLVPVSQQLLIEQKTTDWRIYWAYYVYTGAFILSVTFAVLQILPGKQNLLPEPYTYYRAVKYMYEEQGFNQHETDLLTKSAYIEQLEVRTEIQSIKLQRKTSFYNIAFYLAIIACIAYLYCIWNHLNIEKNNKKQLKSTAVSVVLQKANICGEENKNSNQLMILQSKN